MTINIEARVVIDSLIEDAEIKCQELAVAVANTAYLNSFGCEVSPAKVRGISRDYFKPDFDPYVFSPNVQGKMTINLNYTPLAEIKSVDITAEKKVNLTHGSYNGCMDPIPSTAVLEIIQIK